MNKPTAIMENWSLVHENPYLPPEAQPMFLHGIVYGRDGIKDGTRVSTSSIVQIDKEEYKQIETQHTMYILGKPDKEFVDMLIKQGFPSGTILKERLETIEKTRSSNLNENQKSISGKFQQRPET